MFRATVAVTAACLLAQTTVPVAVSAAQPEPTPDVPAEAPAAVTTTATTATATAPQLAPGILAATLPKVSTGTRHTCLRLDDSSMACWGENDFGQTSAPAGTGFAQVSAGQEHSCAVRDNGSVACWGGGEDDPTGRTIPPTPNTGFAQVTTGDLHTCALKTDTTLSCWGDDGYQQASPPAGAGFRQISAGATHTCAVKNDGSVECWGDNTAGQTTPPAPNTGFEQVSVGFLFSCALKTAGTLVCWGENNQSQASPPAGDGYIQISAGRYHGCAVKSDGSLSCWGRNNRGQATPPEPNAAFTQVSAGGEHTCALRQGNALICWGNNGRGQAPQVTLQPASLPDGTTGSSYSQFLTASGGQAPPYAFSVLTGTLPPGLALSAAGALSGTLIAAGTFRFTALAKDTRTIAGTRDYTVTVTQIGTLVEVASTPNPSMSGQSVTFTLRVSSTTGFTPTGMITLSIDPGAPSITRTLDATGQARYVTADLALGPHAVTATYGGDANVAPAWGVLLGGHLVTDGPITDFTVVNNGPTRLGHATVFTATATGNQISYTWHFGDGAAGPSGPLAVVSHTYATSGRYTATVTATNSAGSLVRLSPVFVQPHQAFLPVIVHLR
jgi:alpha-tubulin suppressor-like RCC1 family protein